jgi:3-methyladenine DNA glycosylase AlkD
MAELAEVLATLAELGRPGAREKMVRFGVRPTAPVYGVSVPALRALAKRLGPDHALADELWESGSHEARLLATMIDPPDLVTDEQVERWVGQVESWDLGDGLCGNLVCRMAGASVKVDQWTRRDELYVKRAGFALLAELAVHDRAASDADFERWLPRIVEAATDERNYVKKAVNWALRQIGKRNPTLNQRAIETARSLRATDSRSARWIAADALRELTSSAVQSRLTSRPAAAGLTAGTDGTGTRDDGSAVTRG